MTQSNDIATNAALYGVGRSGEVIETQGKGSEPQQPAPEEARNDS